MVLPLLLLLGLGALKGLFEPALVPSGWTNVPGGGLSNDAQSAQEQYYHTPTPINLNFDQSYSDGAGPMSRAMTIVDLMMNYELSGPSARDSYVCRKIGLAGAEGVSPEDVKDFQRWVDDELLDWSTMHSECASTFAGTSLSYQLQNTNFTSVSMVFQSEVELESWISGDKYGTFSPACIDMAPGQAGVSGPVCSSECRACTEFSDQCQPEINLAIVFDRVSSAGAGGTADWSFSIRLNTTFDGFPELDTANSPTDDISARPATGAASSYADSGFLTLQSLVQRYIVNEQNGPLRASTSASDSAGRKELFTNLYDTGYSARYSYFTGKSLVMLVEEPGLAAPEACKNAVLDFVTNSETFFPNVVNYVAMPTFSYSYNTFYDVVDNTLPMLFILLFLLSVFLTHSALLVEKETKMREMLKIMVRYIH
jgi:hypothetical protein